MMITKDIFIISYTLLLNENIENFIFVFLSEEDWQNEKSGRNQQNEQSE